MTKMHSLPFLCLLMPEYILQDFTSRFKSFITQCLLCGAGGSGWVGRAAGRGELEDAHPASEEPAQLQPRETPPHELIPWQCKLG